MFLRKVYGIWKGGGVYQEGEKVFIQLDVVYEGKQDGVNDKKVMLSSACLAPSSSQACALGSSDVEQCAWSVRTARDLAETTPVS